MDELTITLIICLPIILIGLGFFAWIGIGLKKTEKDYQSKDVEWLNESLTVNGIEALPRSASPEEVCKALNALRKKFWDKYIDKQDYIINKYRITSSDGSGLPVMLETSTELGLCGTNESHLVFIPRPVCYINEKGALLFSYDTFTRDISYVHKGGMGHLYFTFNGHRYNYLIMDIVNTFRTLLDEVEIERVKTLELNKIQCWDIEGNITEKTTYPSIMGKAATGYIFGGLAGAAVGAALAPAQVEKEDRRKLVFYVRTDSDNLAREEIDTGANVGFTRNCKLIENLLPGKKYRYEMFADSAKEIAPSQTAPKAEAQAPATGKNNVEELKQLKELLDMGILTQEEFDAKKKQLLGL